jgi:tetratricopeptide (TPR) repeat protein
MGWLLLFRFYRFKVAAYWLLPLWLLMEIFSGAVFGQSSGVAHWAHIGGFVFGGLIAMGVRASGLEQMAEKKIQEKISWVSHPLLAEAAEQMDKEQLDAATSSLKKMLQESPDSVDAYRMLSNIYRRKNDLPAYQGALENIIGLEIKAGDPEEAWQTYQDFRNSGEVKLCASVWLDLCRHLETQPDLERAAGLYEELAAAYPGEKQGLLAQMAAGRIYLKRLDRPSDALRLYQAAQASPVPHPDWQPTIDRGLDMSKKALQSRSAAVIPSV